MTAGDLELRRRRMRAKAIAVVTICAMVVIRQRTLKPLVFWFILFGGVGGVFNILTGEVGGGVALMIVMFTMAGIIYRVFR